MIQHKVSDVKIGDQIIIIEGGNWKGMFAEYVGKVGRVVKIYGAQIQTDLINSLFLDKESYIFVDDNGWPFRLAPNGV